MATISRSKTCPRCGNEFAVEYARPETESIASMLDSLFALVHCDPCADALDADLRLSERYARQTAARDESITSGWILHDILAHTFDASKRDFEARTTFIEDAFEWGRHWTPKQQKNSAFIQGTKGAGKSYFAHCILNAAIGYGLTVREVTALTVQDFAMDFEKRRAAQWNLGKIKRVGCLLIEEAGIVSWTEHGVLALREIIDFRYRSHMPTLITSNLSKHDQRDAWDRRLTNKSIVPAMMDRMQYFMGLLFEGDSLRRLSA